VPIKSVHITNYYHKNSGGISTSFNNLLAAAERHRRLIRLIVPGETEVVEEVNEFAKIYYIPAKYSPIFDKRYRLLMPWQYMPNDSPIRRILLEERPDLIEVTDKYTISMLGAMIRIGKFRQLGRPMLVHFSAERMDDNIASFMTKGAFGSWLARRVIGNYTLAIFDFHIANSVYTAQEFYNAYKKAENKSRSDWFFNKSWQFFKAPRIPIEERIYVCPRGVNSELFTPERKSEAVKKEMRERAGIPESSIALLYAGRISPEKNIGLLVEMMKSLAKDSSKDYRLLIAGAGPEAGWLKEQTDKYFPEKIVQFGHLDKELLADYYASADVFVHPNPREPFGIAPLEAMASGVPVVAPNAGGILSYATDENIWLVEPDGESFAAATREAIENPVLRESKIAAALATARANTREKSTDFLLATYDRMFADFQKRKELFTDIEQARKFDFSELVNNES
jgi:glycosyltransferase involved in cell wall biosynthesis